MQPPTTQERIEIGQAINNTHINELIVIVIAIMIGALIIVFSLHSQKVSQFTFNVIGINNASLNASTLVSVHFECIKFCTGYDVNDCYNQCALLGKEQCGD